jgi:coenzyme F420 hydrogenase subunit beta
LQDIERLLAEGGRFAFIGKPCDVSAVRRLARVDARVAAAAPLMLSFFCAGVPSYGGADRVLRAMAFAPNEVASFRYRGNGWPGMARAVAFDGRVAEMSYAESWGEHLSKQLQFRCKICPDGVGGVADIACADAWYGDEDGYPKFEEQDGRSLIIARTKAGERILAQAIAAGRLVTEPLQISEIDAMQPSQARRKRLIESRIAALKATLNPYPQTTGTCVREAARRTSARDAIRSFVGTVRRIIAGRR